MGDGRCRSRERRRRARKSVAGIHASTSTNDVTHEPGHPVTVSENALTIILSKSDLPESERPRISQNLSHAISMYRTAIAGADYPKPSRIARKLNATVTATRTLEKLLSDPVLSNRLHAPDMARATMTTIVLSERDPRYAEDLVLEMQRRSLNALTLIRRRAEEGARILQIAKPDKTPHGVMIYTAIVLLFWRTQLQQRVRFSETSSLTWFMKEAYGLIGEDSTSFDTLRSRHRQADRWLRRQTQSSG